VRILAEHGVDSNPEFLWMNAAKEEAKTSNTSAFG